MPKVAPDTAMQSTGSARPRHIYKVSEITQDIKLILENTFAEIWIEGEVSGFRKIPSGTAFFALKDNASILKCVMFSGFTKTIKFEIKDGMTLICFGRIGVYEKDGVYQLYAEQAEPKGVGSLQLALEQLKQKLEKEGLFRPEHKRTIPYLPAKVGVVTSLTGAAIKDILKVLDRRFSDVSIIIRPSQVQGEGAKGEIAAAIEDLNRFNEKLPIAERIEVMIVGRGGGSIEDLWAFNEEIVARAIYNSKIPVISAVGHERDWTIADLTADLRAATPSVAAELVIPRKEDLREQVDGLTDDLKRALQEAALDYQEDIDNLTHRLLLNMEHIFELSASNVQASAKKLTLLNPALLIQQYKIRTLDLARQIYILMQHIVKLRQARFLTAAEKLTSLSPMNILARGYSISFKMPEMSLIKDARGIKAGDVIRTRLHKGEIVSQVQETENAA